MRGQCSAPRQCKSSLLSQVIHKCLQCAQAEIAPVKLGKGTARLLQQLQAASNTAVALEDAHESSGLSPPVQVLTSVCLLSDGGMLFVLPLCRGKMLTNYCAAL